MKIGVLADTHIPASADRLPQKIYQYFKECNLIIHAGDLTEMSVLSELEKMAETKVVWGNMDSAELKEKLPERILIEAGGKHIGVTHGSGQVTKVIETVRKAFKRKRPDIVIFGHSHTPFNEMINGTLFFNPGSPTDRMFAPYRSFGIIEIQGDVVNAEIVKLN